ncbi:M24 family metallopeptidase [Chelativorans xinjiangense]|uniref:M24 family metallopeptidase n=1 Tax=Chelativorans xinjiangense TaxID=2681485 RepID=UPI002483A3C0|nr:Xaa-Pro peptidase family protein [Chelativorans xinjiangense]
MTLLNADRLHRKMEERKLDAVIATCPENVTYTSGYWALSQWIRRGPQTYVVMPRASAGEPFIVASAGLLDLIIDQPVAVHNVRKFGKFVVEVDRSAALSDMQRRQATLQDLPDDGTPFDALRKGLEALGFSSGRVGVDEAGMWPTVLAELRAAFPGIAFEPAADLFRAVRAVKTPEEIARLKRAAGIAERSIEAALKIAAPGVTEAELGIAFNLETVRLGGEPVLWCIGAGPRSAMMNVQPGERALRMGDIIRFDAGGRYRHYRADIARIAVLGEPTAKTRTYHKALLNGVEYAYEAIRPGVTARDVFHGMVDVVRRAGIPHYDRSHVGHGIGLDGYDLPDLTAGSADVFEEGMVLCVETPYYELGFGGLQVEDMAVVRQDGLESLMSSDGALKVLS